MNKREPIVNKNLTGNSILLESNDKDGRNSEYNKYLDQHISGVKKAYEQFFKSNILSESNFTKEDIAKLENNISNHDKSKYSEEEWIPYLDYFYPEDGHDKEDYRKEFDVACLHHYHNNPHHWNHWILNDDEDKDSNKILDMDEIYVIEMICDWHSFSLKNPESTAFNWWSKNKDKMAMSDNTIKLVDKWIKFVKEPIKK